MNKHIGACILTCVFLRIVYVYELLPCKKAAFEAPTIPLLKISEEPCPPPAAIVQSAASNIKQELLPLSYACSAQEISWQWRTVMWHRPTICDWPYLWNMAQLTMPDATVFFDVGANNGIYSAKFIGLWSPAEKVNPKELSEGLKRIAELPEKTYCADQLYASNMWACSYANKGARGFEMILGPCNVRHPIKVYSFDGNKIFADGMQQTINSLFPQLNNPNSSTWQYSHAAVVGSRFENEEHVTFSAFDKSEGGKVLPGKNRDGVIVPATTVDKFCDENNIDKVDVLKIDAEGHDFEVVDGAHRTLQSRGVSIVFFEGGLFCNGDNSWLQEGGIVDVLDALGFDCYGNGQAVTTYRLTKCFNPSVCEEFSPKNPPANANVFCVSRVHASGLSNIIFKRSAHQQATQFSSVEAFRQQYNLDEK
jgi:FkbM family methyltransferase